MPTLIHWFRRDLRLFDNSALAAAAHDSGGMVLPVFVLDDVLLHPGGRFVAAARVRFLLQALAALDEALQQQHSRLVLRRGNPLEVLPRLLHESGAAGVYWNRDYSPYAVQRDTALERTLRAMGYTVRQYKDAVIWEYDELFTQAGTPYTVYTPYARQWWRHSNEKPPTCAPVPVLRLPAAQVPAAEPLPTLEALGWQNSPQSPWLAELAGGEAAAQRALARFTDLNTPYNISHYAEQRDMLALPATSRLSPHLRLGTLSPRACFQAARAAEARQGTQDATRKEKSGMQVWLGELAWRDFYIQILAHFPHVLGGAFRSEYNTLNWENNAAWFAAWCEGRTGYPIVDAAMRQLNQEAWMHNRGRMIVASFLTKDLLIDWRWGERYFMQHLVDGDPAANNGGWQWAAGTGTDAQPYFRIFNPVSQGKKFDPNGDYVRRYVPELARLPAALIHEPWKLTGRQQRQYELVPGTHYPLPIVDHATQRKQALALYGASKNPPD